MRTTGEHTVGFYGDTQPLVERVAGFLETGLRANDAAILIATPEHRELVEAALTQRGINLASARTRGQYVALDAMETLARFLVAGSPNRKLFDESVGQVLAAAQARFMRVRIYGEMVSLLWSDGKSAAAIALEDLWNEVIGDRLSLLCGYVVGTIGHSANELDGITALHTKVVDPDPHDGRTAA